MQKELNDTHNRKQYNRRKNPSSFSWDENKVKNLFLNNIDDLKNNNNAEIIFKPHNPNKKCV